jgi:hypothetical protein
METTRPPPGAGGVYTSIQRMKCTCTKCTSCAESAPGGLGGPQPLSATSPGADQRSNAQAPGAVRPPHPFTATRAVVCRASDESRPNPIKPGDFGKLRC